MNKFERDLLDEIRNAEQKRDSAINEYNQLKARYYDYLQIKKW